MITFAELANIAGCSETELRAEFNARGLLSAHGAGWEAQVRAVAQRMQQQRGGHNVERAPS